MRFGGYIGAQKILIGFLVSCRQEFLLVCTWVLDFANTTKKIIRSTLPVGSYYDTVATRDESSLVVVEKDLIGVSSFAELYMLEIQNSLPTTLHVPLIFKEPHPRKKGCCLAKNSQNTQFATFNLGWKKFARRELFSSQPFPLLHVFYGVPTTRKWMLLGQKQSKLTICHVYIGLQKVRAARIFFIPAISHVTLLLRRPNHLKMAVTWPKTVKTHKLPRLVWAAKSSRGAKFFHPQPLPMLHVSYGVPTTQKWPLPGQNQSKHTICHV